MSRAGLKNTIANIGKIVNKEKGRENVQISGKNYSYG
jgi:hypothetical protein